MAVDKKLVKETVIRQITEFMQEDELDEQASILDNLAEFLNDTAEDIRNEPEPEEEPENE